MSEISTLHRRAMDLAEEAFEARRAGDTARAEELIRSAFEQESAAADRAVLEMRPEPTRSILLRSAASLGIQAGDLRQSEKLIATALAGDPPADIGEELRDLLEQVNFRRHLALRGVQLEPTEVQLSIAGDAVGYGITDSREFLSRVDIAQKLAYRTAERKRGEPYRDRGKPREQLAKELELYVSVPRAASFAVSLRFGAPEQIELPSDARPGFVSAIVDELLECLQLFDERAFDILRKRIADPAYYRNFIGLARGFAPDGKNVRVVGLTSVSAGQPRYVALSRPRPSVQESSAEPIVAVDRITVTGELRFADSRQANDKIQLITAEGRPVPIKVPPGMMADVVRPMWETNVTVVARRDGRDFVLESIAQAEDSSN